MSCGPINRHAAHSRCRPLPSAVLLNVSSPTAAAASAPRRGGAAVPDGAALRGLLRRRRHAAQVWQLRQLHDRSSGRHVSASRMLGLRARLFEPRRAGRGPRVRLSSVRWRGAGLCRGGPTGLSLLLQRVGRIDLLKHSERMPSCRTVPSQRRYCQHMRRDTRQLQALADRAHSRRRCGRGEPSPGADVAGPSASAFAPGGSAW